MSVADRAIALTNPSSVLDVGCATGMLVQAFVIHGVEAEGIDVSEYAVSHAHADVSGRLRVASATEPLDGRWDLVTCVEVLEHLSPDEAQTAIDNISGATDRVLFSSTPSDFAEATHVNVQPTADWAAWFAERGFFRRADANVSFLTPWAVLFERGDLTPREVTHRYESVLIPLQSEVREKRSALLDLHRQLSRLQGDGGPPRARRTARASWPRARAAPRRPPRRADDPRPHHRARGRERPPASRSSAAPSGSSAGCRSARSSRSGRSSSSGRRSTDVRRRASCVSSSRPPRRTRRSTGARRAARFAVLASRACARPPRCAR